MKKKQKKFTILLVFAGVMIIFCLVYYQSLKRNFRDALWVITYNSGDLNYQFLLDDFFTVHFRYPIDITELHDSNNNDTNYLNEMLAILKDPFSRSNLELGYLPVYHKVSKNCEGYILVSAGIDGCLNILKQDTVYFEDILNLEFYNYFPSSPFLTYRTYDIKFKLFDYFFGQKDILVEHANGIELFVSNSLNRIYSPTEFMNKLYPVGYKAVDCTIEGHLYELNGDTLLVSDGQTNVICSMYKGRRYEVKGDEIMKIVGQFRNKFDPIKKTIYLDNCIMVDSVY